MGVIDTLVLDRTAQDVAALNEKGTYNATDLNRVGEAQAYLAGRFRACGYGVSIAPKLNWTMEDIPWQADMNRYLADLRALRGALRMMETTPPVPGSMAGLTWEQANDIEKILADLEFLLNNMAAAWYYCGEIYAGEV